MSKTKGATYKSFSNGDISIYKDKVAISGGFKKPVAVLNLQDFHDMITWYVSEKVKEDHGVTTSKNIDAYQAQ